MQAIPRLRSWLEIALACASGMAGLVTLVWRDRTKAVFGFDPDHRSGSLEWIIVGVLVAAAVVVGSFARAGREQAPAMAGR
jgi:hypothetical protein